MANIAYIRVSSAEQNEERQLDILKQYQIDRYFSEKVSAKDMHRPQLQEMLRYVREGDTLYICDFSRLARSTMDLLSIVDQLQNKNVQLISIKENIDTSTPTGKLMLQMNLKGLIFWSVSVRELNVPKSVELTKGEKEFLSQMRNSQSFIIFGSTISTA